MCLRWMLQPRLRKAAVSAHKQTYAGPKFSGQLFRVSRSVTRICRLQRGAFSDIDDKFQKLKRNCLFLAVVSCGSVTVGT